MTHLESETQVMVKSKVENQIGNLTPDHKKSRIDLIFLRASDVKYTIAKILTRLQLCFKLHLN